jgi:ribosome-associated heat shock protein Hsp15
VTEGRIRLDKWLWHARFCKTRGLAAKLCETGLLRLNEQPVRKPAQAVRPGDRLEVPRGKLLMTIEILKPGTRRGPSREAATLYYEPDPGRRRALASDAWEPLLDDDPEAPPASGQHGIA